MSRRGNVFVILGAIVIASLTNVGAARAQVTLGASFGYTHITYRDISELKNDIIDIPGSEEWGQPGMRVGYHLPGGRWELNADVGLVHRSGTIFPDETSAEMLPQVQVNWPRDGVCPFVNAGAGVEHETVPNFGSATRPVLGAGLGLRKSISGGHGLVRLEVRYDHVAEHMDETVTFPSTNMVSVKLGFDLLVTR